MEQKRIQPIRDDIKQQMAHIREPLFASKASSQPGRYLNACLHLTPEGWDTYAEGYRKAGDILVEYIRDSKRDQDYLVYPIAFLYRQYLELRLKELWRVSSAMLESGSDPLTGHDLMQLWHQVRPNIEQEWLGHGIKSDLSAIEERLEEIFSVDPVSQAFRYPEYRSGATTLPGMREINLGQLQTVMQAISNILDGISYAIGEYLKWQHERKADR
jgi:hypothetical protein